MSLPVIRAELSGSEIISVGAETVSAKAPIIALCVRLLDAGYDPGCSMEVYRGDNVAVRVRSIGEVAKLRIMPRADGRPIIAKQSSAAAPYGRLKRGMVAEEA